MIRLLAVVLAVPVILGQVEVDVTDLDTTPERYDGKTVVITGEVVGDYGLRTDHVWVQLNTDAYVSSPLLTRADARGSNQGIGVRYPAELHDEAWGDPGGYGVRGPILRIEGVFRYNDTATSGETFVDAGSIELVEPARSGVVREPEAGVWIFAILCSVGGVALYGSAWIRRRRRLT